VYNPQLLLENVTLLSGIQVVVTSCVGVVMIAAFVEGYLFGRMNLLMRVVSLVGALMLIDSGPVTDLIGVGCLVLVLAAQKFVFSKRTGGPTAVLP
ncbi:MAG: C4-dicarboxylate ABC transporter permease, partial [Lawsonibacter sp.]